MLVLAIGLHQAVITTASAPLASKSYRAALCLPISPELLKS